MALGDLVGKKRTREAHLNIVSMLDILVIIVVFLLYNVSFEVLHLSTVNASVPTVADENTVVEIQKQSVNMTVQIKPTGLKLSGGNEYLSEEEMSALNAWIPARGGNQDAGALQRTLGAIKKRYPKSTTLIIVPEDDIAYEAIVEVMDAARDVKPGKKSQKDAEPVPLFPNVVVSSLVK